MILVPCVVSPSSIDGVGLFADENIKKGTMIWKLTPDTTDLVVTKENATGMLNTFGSQFKAIFEKYAYFDTELQQFVTHLDEMKYMNHSSTPNTFTTDNTMYAIKDIKKGEELTEDYVVYGRSCCASFLFPPSTMP
jgi:SET domain-containing protein